MGVDGDAAVKIERLKALVEQIEAKKSDADDVRSALGNLYKAAEDYGFHRTALKLAIKLKGMEPEKRNDFLSSLGAYCDDLGVWTQGDLFNAEPRVPRAPDLAEQTPRDLGELAAKAGAAATANPFARGTPDADAWGRGWTVAVMASREARNGKASMPDVPRELGFAAGRAGKSLDENPFTVGSDSHAAWKDGHADGRAPAPEAKGEADPPPRRRGRPRTIRAPATGAEHPDLPPAA